MATPILYIKRGCPYCQSAKNLLDQKKIAYEEFDVRADPAQMEKMKEVSGQAKTPTLVWNGEVLADFGSDQLEAFLAERVAP